MKRSTKYVALDVHRATMVASVREETGRVIARSIFDIEKSAILDFFDGMRGSVQETVEEGSRRRGFTTCLSRGSIWCRSAIVAAQ